MLQGLGRHVHAVPGRANAGRRLALGLLHRHQARRKVAVLTSSAQSHPALSIDSQPPEPPAGQASEAAASSPAASAAGNHHSAATASTVAAVPASSADGAAESAVAAAETVAPLAAAADAAEQPQEKKKGSNFINRVIFGIILGFGGAAVVAAGKVPYLCAALFVVYHATQEFYGMVTSKGISKGMAPPPPFVSAATTALCLSITVFTYFSHGRSGAAMSVAAFCLLAMNVLANRKPTFAQLTSSVFGLFYCGYLPSFWIKLRNLDVSGPVLNLPGVSSEVAASLCSYLPNLTVGLVATLTTVACIIAADTGAYFVGKNLGRTKLTDISPKKTVEGAVGGLASAIAVAVLFWKLFSWPGSALAAAGYGVLTFFSSLFGDLIESIMKRDAGIKDSGNLIPGHGGLLDRFDSYMFSGALAYFYITLLLPKFGLV